MVIDTIIEKKQRQIELLKQLETVLEMEKYKYVLETIFVDSNTVGILREVATGNVIKHDKLSHVISWLNIRNLKSQTYMKNEVNASTYQKAKERLKETAKEIKKQYPNDKPLINMTINDTVDYLSKDLNLTEYQRNLLSDYACKLHA